MKKVKSVFRIIFLLLLLVSCSGKSDDDTAGEVTVQKSVGVYLTTRYSTLKLTEQGGIDFSNDVSNLTIRLDSTNLKQEIDGFGAALTGSSAYLIENMSSSARQVLLKKLFTEEGIGIKYLRICIGASDFSLGNYTYCDTEGIENFSIPAIDKRNLLPVLKEILALNKDIKIVASPWTAPAWMKGNNNLYGGSLIGASVYDDFAEYFVKYIRAFENEGINIDAITIQNEPRNENSYYPTMYMSWSEQNQIVRDYLGPKFASEGIDTKILIWDHNFDEVDYPINILNDTQTRGYVSGVAFHGYAGTPDDLDALILAHPDVPIYFTEQSGGGWNTDDAIGNMLYYMKDMLMPTINLGSRNFLMWNLALNENNGPVTTTGGGCQNCRGVVTIKDSETYSFNEEYYLLGHFSKFIKAGAHRIAYTIVGTKPSSFQICAFLNPDGSKVLVVLNQSGSKQQFTVRNADRRFTYSLADQSVATFIYN